MFHIARNRPNSVAEVSCLRNLFSHATSTSASPVVPGVSVTRQLTNAANVDMNGCSIRCPFCPLASSLYAFPCALAAANAWNEVTSPSTCLVRQRNPSRRRLDWAHCSKSSSRCVTNHASRTRATAFAAKIHTGPSGAGQSITGIPNRQVLGECVWSAPPNRAYCAILGVLLAGRDGDRQHQRSSNLHHHVGRSCGTRVQPNHFCPASN